MSFGDELIAEHSPPGFYWYRAEFMDPKATASRT